MLPYFHFSQRQFPLGALPASMAVQPETVTRPPGVSVTVDTSWGELEDFVMVSQSEKQMILYIFIGHIHALKNLITLHCFHSTPIVPTFLPLLLLISLPFLLFFSLPFFPFPSLLPFPFSLPPLFSPSFPLPIHFYFFLPPPDTDINECTQGNTGCEQGCLNKIGFYKCHCFLGYQRANATHCSKLIR